MKGFSQYGLTAALATCFLFCFMSPAVAVNEVTGIVQEVGFNQFIMVATGAERGVRYNTGRETQYVPRDYRAKSGDTITIRYYKKLMNSGSTILAVSSLVLEQSDPNRKELVSPAIGVIKEVGRAKIRITYTDYNQTISWSKNRGMRLIPAGYIPLVGDKVEVYFEKVQNKWTGKSGVVITTLKKIN